MNGKIPPWDEPGLPATVAAFTDEALLGLAVRHAAANHYPSATWIGDLVQCELRLACRTPEAVERLALCFGLERREAFRRSFLPAIDGYGNSQYLGAQLINFWGHAVADAFVDQTRTWLCPVCYGENRYLKAIWSLTLYRACHVHECPLIWRCPHCRRKAPID
jgi:hypothetical protein